jgi:hypothetical protein
MIATTFFFSFIIFFVSVKFLEVIKPFCSILPEIAKPERKVRVPIVGGMGGQVPFNNYFFCADPISGKSIMDCNHIVHFLSMLPGM